MYYSKKFGLKPGDQIVEFITPLGIGKHFAMYLGWDQNGIEWIAENKKLSGVRIIAAKEYFRDVFHIARIQKFIGNRLARRWAVQNALKKIGKPYNLIDYNCEHFVTEVATGKAKSRQVENVAIGLIGIFLLAVLAD